MDDTDEVKSNCNGIGGHLGGGICAPSLQHMQLQLPYPRIPRYPSHLQFIC